jgi:hypothetical protein
VIPHQHGESAHAGKGTHAVVERGNGFAGGEPLAEAWIPFAAEHRARQRAIGEARGKIEDAIGIRGERPVAHRQRLRDACVVVGNGHVPGERVQRAGHEQARGRCNSRA